VGGGWLNVLRALMDPSLRSLDVVRCRLGLASLGMPELVTAIPRRITADGILLKALAHV
tara:strand:+ start:62 stop:238 length:177 start_codon:yes stop_codon:yes gene_type:complete